MTMTCDFNRCIQGLTLHHSNKPPGTNLSAPCVLAQEDKVKLAPINNHLIPDKKELQRPRTKRQLGVLRCTLEGGTGLSTGKQTSTLVTIKVINRPMHMCQ